MTMTVMSDGDRHRPPPGWQWYDPLNGLRVGALAGGVIGAVIAAVWSPVGFWLVIVTAAAGGGIGMMWVRRRLRGRAPGHGEGRS